MKSPALKNNNLLYADLTGKVIGILFDVYNTLGHGLQEKVYQKAVAVALESAGIKFKEQLYAPMTYLGKRVGSNFFDFLIEDKLVLELKKGDRFVKSHIDQVYQYLEVKI